MVVISLVNCYVARCEPCQEDYRFSRNPIGELSTAGTRTLLYCRILATGWTSRGSSDFSLIQIVQTVSGSHATSFSVPGAFSPGAKQPVSDSDNSHASSDEVKERVVPYLHSSHKPSAYTGICLASSVCIVETTGTVNWRLFDE